jgi:hypothetical protein
LSAVVILVDHANYRFKVPLGSSAKTSIRIDDCRAIQAPKPDADIKPP